MKNYENIIKENAQRYYEDGTQNLSDRAFDALIDEVKKENPNSEVLKTGWGYEVDKNGKVKHKYGHIGSLKKLHNFKEINSKFESLTKIDVSAKLDGLSAVIYFNDGKITKAVTRGNGEYGVDITDKVVAVLGNNKINDKTFTGAVRGELTMPVKEFEIFKKSHPEAKNSRNSTAGLINGDEITEDYKYIKFVVYSIIADTDKNYNFDVYSYFDIITAWFEVNFSDVAPRKLIYLNSDIEQELKKLKDIWSEDWFIDGVVLSDNTIRKKDSQVIQTSYAYKFEDEVAITKVIDIDWNMSKNSEMIPVLQIEPVELEGTTVKRVTAFNAKFVLDNNLGSGATILVCKRNQIIPYVMEVIKPAKFPDLPSICEYCGEYLLWDKNHVHICCFNKHCAQKENEDLKAICMNLAPIDGLGWKTISKCFNDSFYQANNYKFNTLEDILNADLIPGVTSLEGHGEKTLFNNMLKVIQCSTITVSKFLLALNIPGLGKISAKRWEDSKNAIKYLDFIANGSMCEDDICYIELEKILQDKNVVASLKTTYNHKFRKYYNLLEDRIKHVQINTNYVPSQCGDVCITGTLSMKRADFEKLLIQKGWTLVTTIKTSTKFLITNTPDSGTSKNKKADELGVKKITEKEFIEKYL